MTGGPENLRLVLVQLYTKNWTRMGDVQVVSLLGQPALVQLVDKANSSMNEKEKKELFKKVETRLKSFDGKGKLTVDDFYSVLKVQVRQRCFYFNPILFKENVDLHLSINTTENN